MVTDSSTTDSADPVRKRTAKLVAAPRIGIVAFPTEGPYAECFYKALERHGARVETGIWAGRWLFEQLRWADFVHFHWPSYWYSQSSSRLGFVRNFLKFVLFLFMIRLRGRRILWTAHNLYPHQRSPIPWLDRLGRLVLIALSYRVLVHGPSALEILRQEFGLSSEKALVIDHGHWINYYPNVVSREEARASLGVAAPEFVFLFVGFCRPYKNLIALIESFAMLPPGPQLIIAGRFIDPNYAREVENAIRTSSARITLRQEYIPDSRLQHYLNCADVVVLPYAEILTSGALMLATSFGKPVVAPRRGYLEDVISEESGILYDFHERDALRRAMQESMTRSYDSERIMGIARRHDWEAVAERVAAELRR